MAKFDKKADVPHPSLASGKPLPAEASAAMPQPAAAPAAATEPALVIAESKDMAREFTDINSDGTEKAPDRDMPNTKDYEFADHTSRIGGTRQFMNDGLTRQLCCTMYLLDVSKKWGHNPLGGPPVEVVYSREFPEIRVLYDTFGQSPETATQELVMKMVEFKRKLAHDHGFRYLHQHGWAVLTSDELTKQLAAEDAWKAGRPK